MPQGKRFMIKQEKIWKFLVFVLFSFQSVDAASALSLRDNVFATLDLESSFVSTEIVNKGITRFKLDFGYEQTFFNFFGDRELLLHASYSFRYGPNASDLIGDT